MKCSGGLGPRPARGKRIIELIANLGVAVARFPSPPGLLYAAAMETQDKNAAAIWKQNSVPVIYRQGGSQPLMIRLPFAKDNRDWLQSDRRRTPEWNARFKCWDTPRSWFDDVVTRSLQRFGRIYVIQPYRVQEKCAPACWNARGFECECSCMGAHHGSRNPSGKWRVISDTFAIEWHGRQLACRLIEASHPDDESVFLDDPLGLYLAELHKLPPLTREEEISCIHHVRAGDEQAESAGQRLTEANLLLVVSIAERYRNDRTHILDLIQKGNDGLLRALRTLSDSREDSFPAHAAAHIERAIVEAVAASRR